MPINMLHPSDQRIIRERIASVAAMRRADAERAVEETIARHFEKVGSGKHAEFSDLDAGLDRVFEVYKTV